MKSYQLSATINAAGELTARVPLGLPVGEAKIILLVPETESLLLSALDALPVDPESHAHWQDDAARIEREREEWA